LIFFVLIFISSCQTSEIEQPEKTLGLFYPDYVPKPVYGFEKNKLTNEGIQLGRMLFYDPILSSDSTISCGSCHAQAHAFADHNMKLSIGVNNRMGLRNSPPIFNLAWHPNFMWDGGVNHIEIIPLAPLTNH
jgi:cytochrome c peroxidase